MLLLYAHSFFSILKSGFLRRTFYMDLGLFEHRFFSKHNYFGGRASRFSLLLFILWASHFCNAQTGYSIGPRARHVIDSTYQLYIKKYKITGVSLAIVDSGKIVYASGYGFSDELNKIAADETTIYRIGSITKSFTALSILQLSEKGLVSINSPLNSYLPELTIKSRFKDQNPIIIRDVLSHVSGLPCDITNGVLCDSPPDINWVIRNLNKQTTISPTRYKQAYSNVGYGLLGEIIARQHKTTFSEAVKTNIFLPLQMRSSYIDTDTALQKNYSKGYYHHKETIDPLIRDQGAGMIHSNVTDMCNYINMFVNNGVYMNTRVVSDSSIREMQKDQISDATLPSTEQYGYGLSSEPALLKKGTDSTAITLVGHTGDTYVFHSGFKFIPELKLGVILLSNTGDVGWIVNADRLLKLYLKESYGARIKINDHRQEKSLSNTNNDIICSEDEMKGVYNFGGFVIKVKQAKKIQFKQGHTTIKFYQKKKDPTIYTAKAFLYNMLPVKVKDQEFTFVKFKGEVYIKETFTNTKEQEYFGIRTEEVPLSNTWKSKLGKYVMTGDRYPCKDCPFLNMENMKMQLSEKNGCLLMKTSAKTKDTHNELYLNILSDEMAVGGGIGRGTGETVRLLENGDVYYSGFEFKKIK